MGMNLRSIMRTYGMRRTLVFTAQLLIFAMCGVMAFLLRFDFRMPAGCGRYLGFALPVWIIIKGFSFHLSKLNRRGYRYLSTVDVYRLGITNLAGSFASYLIIVLAGPAGFPRAIYLIDFVLCLLCTAGVPLSGRIIAEAVHRESTGGVQKRTLIYGAGDAGITLLREIRNNPRLAYNVRGFVDDRLEKKGVLISGLPVVCDGQQVGVFVKQKRIETILIAIPSATGTQMTRILELCHKAKVECKTVPGLGEIIEGRGLVGQIREVAVDDLLGRVPVHLDEEMIRGSIANKVVLVTGAAGSIGSELCRQIAKFSPAGIVGFDAAESPLFEIDREMQAGFPQVPFHAEIGSVQNRMRLDEVISQHRPTVVYHAAAYKHVPLMEAHAFEAVENNVLGTYNLAMAALEHGVDDFVMISSDKAVHPTNVMGATKRLAELLLLGLQNGSTQFVTVRFGNVLGSNGSVIPIFKQQILAGGPVTVTHPEMRRFFMTIPEACQLVLQASTLARGGQICVLDMGQPVKILDLARNLILLSGLKPDEDIKIQFTGMRPGEKLYEELSSLMEDTVPTDHEKIRIFVGNGIPDVDTQEWLEALRQICQSRDLSQLIIAIKELVPDYNPSTPLLRRALELEEIESIIPA